MDFTSGLNPEQREAVLQADGAVLILAGAGSGKTRVIAHRIAHIVASGLAPADGVLAVTFTNKAAEEMRTRVSALLGADCSRMWISTFHSLSARLLRREAPAIGLSRDFVIYDSSDQLSVVKQAMKELNIDDALVQPRAALSRISHAKNLMEGPEVLERGWNPRDKQIAKIYRYYLDALHESHALDFDDLLLKTVELVEKAEHVRARYANQFRYVMVDEYQDTNRPQYMLVRRFAERHGNICVVGDPDQSIYKWRGADLKNILDFEHDFPNATVVRLERNYRSTQVILDAASAVIRCNRNRKEKRLWTDQEGGARILLYRGGDELEEADFIMRTSRRALVEDAESTIAILYRINSQSRAIEDALMREGVAYKIVGSVRFYERKEIKDALAYLKLIVNPFDDVSLRRVINVPTRGIGRGVMDGLDQLGPPAELPPLLAAGLEPVVSSNALWVRLQRAISERALAPQGASVARGVPRPHRRLDRGRHAGAGVHHGRQDARPVRLPPRPARGSQRRGAGAHREPDGAGVGGQGVRGPGPRAVAWRLRRSAVPVVGDRRGGRRAHRARVDDDHARRQGAGVPRRRHCRTRGRPVPALTRVRGRRRARGRAAAVLRRDDAGAAAAGADRGRTTAHVWRVQGHQPVAIPR